jgi:hypothetical protein
MLDSKFHLNLIIMLTAPIKMLEFFVGVCRRNFLSTPVSGIILWPHMEITLIVLLLPVKYLHATYILMSN